MNKKLPIFSRRAFLGSCLMTTACVAADQQSIMPPREVNGIRYSQSGPNIHLYRNAFGYPTANRHTYWSVEHSVDGFSNLGNLLPSRRSLAGSTASTIRQSTIEPNITYQGSPVLERGTFNVDDYLNKHPVTGLIITKGNQILVERYQYSRTDQHQFTSFSMAKTLIAIMIGIAVSEGHISSIDDKAETYVSSLAGTEFGATPIRYLLTMSSGIQFRENYFGNDDVATLSRLTIQQNSFGGAWAIREFNTRISAPGQTWNYSSADTYVLALVLKNAIKKNIATYFSEKIWQPIGAESTASWLIDAAGNEVGYMGFNAVLRDYARLAIMLAHKGKYNNQQIIPPVWFNEMFNDQTGTGYGFQTWIYPRTFPNEEQNFALKGVRGQGILIDTNRQIALIQTAVRTRPVDGVGNHELLAFWHGIKRSLR